MNICQMENATDITEERELKEQAERSEQEFDAYLIKRAGLV